MSAVGCKRCGPKSDADMSTSVDQFNRMRDMLRHVKRWVVEQEETCPFCDDFAGHDETCALNFDIPPDAAESAARSGEGG